jgi:hypothetical protein
LKIAFFGDSWAKNSCIGVVSGDEKIETHGSYRWTELFEKEGFVAVDYAVGGGCNDQTIDQLDKHKQELKDVDYIIIFQTDPLRDLKPNHNFSNRLSNGNKNTIQSNLKILNAVPTNNFNELTNFLLERFYKQLNQFNSIKHKFLLIGGLGSINAQLVPKEIKYLTKSVTEYLVPNFNAETPYEFMGDLTDVGECVRKLWGWNKENMINDLFELEKKIQWKNYIWQNSELFSWCHMSDSGMLKMFSILMKELHNIKKEVLNG